MKNIFINGPISSEFVAQSIAKHETDTNIGGHNIFLGQVRADVIDGKEVKAIEYSGYIEMAEKEIKKICESAFEKFNIIDLNIYHSLGMVKAGEICFFVFVSSRHRNECYKASRFVVDEIKAKVPIFGKELFDDETYSWKENE